MADDVPFQPPGRPANEVERQRALDRLGVLDSPREQSIDDLAWLAAFVCQTPIAVVGLIDNDRQWFKAECGLGGTEAPRDLTFCAHTILGAEIVEVHDATLDPRFAGNPFVLGEPHVRFYAGVPLIGSTGYAYGTLCVVDQQPRSLSDAQREALTRLARQAVKQLETRRSRNEAKQTRQALAHLLEAMPDGLVSCGPNGELREFNQTARDWHGADLRQLPPEHWAEAFDLFTADGSRHLRTDEIPLLRAIRGEVVRDAEIVIKAKGLPARPVLCNAAALKGADGQDLGAVCVMRDVTELRATEAHLRESEMRLRRVLEGSYDAFIAIEDDGTVREWNPAAETLFGWSAAEAVGQPMADLIVPDAYRDGHNVGMRRFLETGQVHVLNKRLQLPARHRLGHEFPVEMTISLVELGRRRTFTAFLHDISKRVEVERQLRESEARLRTITDNAPALIAYIDREERFQFTNTAFEEWYGVEPGAALGQTVEELRGAAVAAMMRPYMARALAGERVAMEADITHAALGPRHCHLTLIPDAQAGTVRGYHVMAFDITAQKKLTHVLQERALRDELTGLPNRAAWNEELRRGLARASRLGAPAAVMFLDLDGFKAVNDAHGHAAGDAVLRQFAKTLRATLRASDLVARLSGDEFVVLLDRVGDLEGSPPKIAAKILAAFEAGMDYQGHHLPIRPSIGIAVQRGPTFDADELLRCADEAMYAAKRSQVENFTMVDCVPAP